MMLVVADGYNTRRPIDIIVIHRADFLPFTWERNQLSDFCSLEAFRQVSCAYCLSLSSIAYFLLGLLRIIL